MPLEPRQIFIVDCFSTDETKAIVSSFSTNHHPQNPNNHPLTTNYHFVEHEWPGNQAAQFNWALDHLPIESKWILRIDADEWLTQELISEIMVKLPQLPDDVAGVVLKRRHVVGWLGDKWIKHGMYPTRILRLFRTGGARYAENMSMDEHLVVNGKTIGFDNDFIDESLISFEDWQLKHRGYAKREAQMVVSGKANANKRMYYRFPPYLRAFIYFLIRYFIKLGILDGMAGLLWHFWHCLWYRCLVDCEVGRIKAHA